MRSPRESRTWVIALGATWLLRADPAPILVTVAFPVVLIAFLIPTAAVQLHQAGYAGASGAAQVVPGMAVLFSFMSTSLICSLFFREHAWGTWARLRASAASPWQLIVGKVVPLYVCILGQMTVLFAAGAIFFGYRPNGSWGALAAVLAVFVAALVFFGVMLVAVCRTFDQAQVTGNLGGMVMAGLGGALSPISALPTWAQDFAHLTPAYWALRALQSISLDHGALAHVAPDIAVLAGFAVVFAVVALTRFRPNDAKIGTT